MDVEDHRLLDAAPKFQLFGMGDRPKFVFSGSVLRRLPGCSAVHEWAHGSEAVFHPDKFMVEIGGEPVVWEDSEALWWRDGGVPVCLARSSAPLSLPDFAECPSANMLRALIAEVLVNIDGGLPLPNFLVYRKPWRRDGAMMAMVLEATGNLHLLSDWAASLEDPFDRNNAGNEEPDNLGQTLFILGRIGFGDSPLVARIVAESKRRIMADGALAGIVDGRRHAVYAAAWLRLGLEACGLDWSWVPVPDEYDDYGPLFWMRREWVGQKAASTTVEYDVRYPYLWWAKAHFNRYPVPAPALVPGRPLSWESNASEANYAAIAPISGEWSSGRFAAPHTWHASEMFLYLADLQ